jgi:GT2 family glycosyltransferase
MLRTTLLRLLSERDPPDEILVHADAGDTETPEMLRREFPGVRCLQSSSRQGPGGGRNVLVNAAMNGVLVSLDDDSWPHSPDFFSTARELFASQPQLDLVACKIVEADEQSDLATSDAAPPQSGMPEGESVHLTPAASFVGCGVMFRQTAFREAGGYLPLEYAYGMEEADLALKLLNQGRVMARSDRFRVFHDCERNVRHADRRINAAQITNTALLAFLRYPLTAWPYGILQIVSRVGFAVKKRRFAGILSGLAAIVPVCWRNRHLRQPVKFETVRLSRQRQSGR